MQHEVSHVWPFIRVDYLKHFLYINIQGNCTTGLQCFQEDSIWSQPFSYYSWVHNQTISDPIVTNRSLQTKLDHVKMLGPHGSAQTKSHLSVTMWHITNSYYFVSWYLDFMILIIWPMWFGRATLRGQPHGWAHQEPLPLRPLWALLKKLFSIVARRASGNHRTIGQAWTSSRILAAQIFGGSIELPLLFLAANLNHLKLQNRDEGTGTSSIWEFDLIRKTSLKRHRKVVQTRKVNSWRNIDLNKRYVLLRFAKSLTNISNQIME